MVDVKLEVDGGSDVVLRVSEDEGASLGVEVPYIGGGGYKDYEKLENKPRIEGVELVGDRKLTELVAFGPELVYASRTLDVDVMTAQQVANLLTDD